MQCVCIVCRLSGIMSKGHLPPLCASNLRHHITSDMRHNTGM